MYTDQMKRAFRSLRCPEGFSLELIDNDTFITVKAKEKVFMSLETVEKKKQAIEYMVRVKKALEDNGAIVLLVREGGKEL
jgi:cytochrome c-type biogenesis protein CcmH/NrfF